jgi:hypothetical protein
LRAAAAFCGEFRGRKALRRLLTYKADAARFDELNRRLCEVYRETGLAIDLDDAAWRAAQAADNADWGDKLEKIEACFVDGHSIPERVTMTVEQIFGHVDRAPEQLVDTASFVESLLQMRLQSKDGGVCQREQADMRAIWEINPLEITFDQRKDEFGEMRRVSLGEGAFGEVLRGACVLRWLLKKEKKNSSMLCVVFLRTNLTCLAL